MYDEKRSSQVIIDASALLAVVLAEADAAR